ncbi:MAG: two pore domain potassium channel family protein [Chloroflexi bacterium]|nr:MAG: two pore domain potassium channel family protein [Chloroflexota bacterium]
MVFSSTDTIARRNIMKKRGNLFYLLLSLLFLLLAYPSIERFAVAGKILALFFSFVLVAGIYAVSGHNRTKVIISFILAVPAIAIIWFDQFFASKMLDIATFTLLVLFSFFTMGCIVSYLLSAKRVTKDILAGAASAYLLMGISWSMLCGLLELIIPGSFAVNEAIGVDALSRWSTFNYYSFTTLTTLGYGDITPITSRAQSFAILESVMGVLFTALLISRLVGMYLYQLKEGNSN